MNMLKPLNDRINSPLYSTFVIAWCISNWQIFYVTFFITQRELGDSKLEFVINHLTFCNIWNSLHTVVIPLVATFVYIYLLPWLDNKVSKTFYEMRAKRKATKVTAMEKSPITAETYRALLMRYTKREEELTKFFDKERTWLEEKQNMTSQALIKAQELNENNAIIQKYRQSSTAAEIFKGRWKNSFVSTTNEHLKGEEYFFIQSNNYFREQEGTPKYEIRYFHYDFVNDRAFFLKKTENNQELLFTELRKIDETTYEGNEYGIKPKAGAISYKSYNVIYRKSGSEEVKPPVGNFPIY